MRLNQLLWLLLIVAIAACTNTITDRSKLSNSKPPLTDCRIIQHAMGETCVPNHPSRVVTISRAILSNTLALGFKPIGTTVWEIEELKTYVTDKSFLGDKVKEITDIGQPSNVSLEKISLLKPDLILAPEYSVKETYPLISQIAPTVAISGKNLDEDWKKGFDITAEALGKETKARQVWNHYNRRIKEIKASLGDRYKNKTISVGGAFTGRHGVFIFVKGSFIDSILNDLGLQRPIAQQVSAPYGAISGISEEKLDLLDGDILFVVVSNVGHTEAYESLKQKPLWKKLKAVREGQVYLVDVFAWLGTSPLAADAVLDDIEKYLIVGVL